MGRIIPAMDHDELIAADALDALLRELDRNPDPAAFDRDTAAKLSAAVLATWRHDDETPFGRAVLELASITRVCAGLLPYPDLIAELRKAHRRVLELQQPV